MSAAELWRRGQVGWPQRFPLMQFPNLPLLVALAAWVVAAASNGAVHDVARGAFTLGLIAWAAQELATGVNWFRRLLGAAALAWIVVKLAGQI